MSDLTTQRRILVTSYNLIETINGTDGEIEKIGATHLDIPMELYGTDSTPPDFDSTIHIKGTKYLYFNGTTVTVYVSSGAQWCSFV